MNGDERFPGRPARLETDPRAFHQAVPTTNMAPNRQRVAEAPPPPAPNGSTAHADVSNHTARDAARDSVQGFPISQSSRAETRRTTSENKQWSDSHDPERTHSLKRQRSPTSSSIRGHLSAGHVLNGETSPQGKSRRLSESARQSTAWNFPCLSRNEQRESLDIPLAPKPSRATQSSLAATSDINSTPRRQETFNRSGDHRVAPNLQDSTTSHSVRGSNRGVHSTTAPEDASQHGLISHADLHSTSRRHIEKEKGSSSSRRQRIIGNRELSEEDPPENATAAVNDQTATMERNVSSNAHEQGKAPARGLHPDPSWPYGVAPLSRFLAGANISSSNSQATDWPWNASNIPPLVRHQPPGVQNARVRDENDRDTFEHDRWREQRENNHNFDCYEPPIWENRRLATRADDITPALVPITNHPGPPLKPFDNDDLTELVAVNHCRRAAKRQDEDDYRQ